MGPIERLVREAWGHGVCVGDDRDLPVLHHLVKDARGLDDAPAAPIPMRIHCPKCGDLHLDEGEFATKVHATHSCQRCGLTFRPAVVPTVGVRFLPGFKNEDPPIDWNGVLPHDLRVACADCGAGSTNAPGAYGWTFAKGEWRCEVHSALPLSGEKD